MPILPIILAGPGEDLYPITDTGIDLETSNNEDPRQVHGIGMAKALLPVGGKPMIEWVVEWMEREGMSELLLLAPTYQQSQLSHYIRTRKSISLGHSSSITSVGPDIFGPAIPGTTSLPNQGKIRIDLQCIDLATFKRGGTAGALRWAAERGFIRSDFLLLPCDLYFAPKPFVNSTPITPPSSILQSLLYPHLSHSSLITSLFYQRAAGSVPKESKSGPREIVCGIDACPPPSGAPGDARLVLCEDLAPEEVDDGDEGSEGLFMLRSSAVTKYYPKMILTTSILPAHVYLCSIRVLDVLRAFPEMTSFKEDVISVCCKMQWQKGLRTLANETDEDAALEGAGKKMKGKRHKSGLGAVKLPIEKEEGIGWERSTTWVGEQEKENASGGAATRRRTKRNLRVRAVLDAEQGIRMSAAGAGSGSDAGATMTSATGEEEELASSVDPEPSDIMSLDDREAIDPDPLNSLASHRPPTAASSNLISSAAFSGPLAAGGPTVNVSNRRKSASVRGKENINYDPTYEWRYSGLTKDERVGVVVWDADDGFMRRGNEMAGYLEMNRTALQQRPNAPHPTYPPNVVAPDSVLHSSVVVGERSNIKKTTIDKGASIGKMSKINICIIMERAVIGDSVKLENCIICPGARIGDRSNLKDCEVAAAYEVEPETTAKNDKLALN